MKKNRYPDEAELRKTYFNRTAWGFLALTLGLSLVASALIVPIFLYEIMIKSVLATRIFYTSFVITLALFIYSLHQWSIHVVSRLYIQVRRDKKNEEVDALGLEPCYYCGEDNAPIICGKCDSIQWPGLSHAATGIEDTETFWATGVFIAHHRFKLLAAAFSFLIVGIFPFAYRVEQERVNQEHERIIADQNAISEINSAISDVTGFRAALFKFETLCEAGFFENSLCEDIFEEIVTSYFKFSWDGPQIIALSKKRHCADRAKLKEELEKIIDGPEEPIFNNYQLQIASCGLLSHYPVIADLDDLFLRYIGSRGGTRTTENAVEKENGEICRKKIEAAHTLYYAGRRSSCAIVLAAAPLFGEGDSENSPLPSNEGCVSEMKKLIEIWRKERVEAPRSTTAWIEDLDLKKEVRDGEDEQDNIWVKIYKSCSNQ